MKNGKFEKKDLDSLNEFYKNNGAMTTDDFRNMVDELAEWSEGESEEDKKDVELWNAVRETTTTADSIFLYDVKDEDAFGVIIDIMATLHYDNGKPLVGDDYNYFDNYDRDQDFWGFYEDAIISHFELDKDGNLMQILVMTKEDLKDLLTDEYDGASWEHDYEDGDDGDDGD